MYNVNRIILPTDLSSFSLTAFDYAKDIAERNDSEIYIIYVLDKNPPLVLLQSSNGKTKMTKDEYEGKIKKEFNSVLRQLQDSTNAIVKGEIRVGDDSEEIISLASEIKADLIILSTHSRTGFLRSILGSVADKVIQNAKCPILVIPPIEEE
jgi:nucleotide-binding universal stress UspA family protein